MSLFGWIARLRRGPYVAPSMPTVAAPIAPVEHKQEAHKPYSTEEWKREVAATVMRGLSGRGRPASRPKDAPD